MKAARMWMKMSKVMTIGELLIDFVPTENGTALKDVPQFERAAGGAPANVAAAVTTLGGRAHFIGKVGLDAFGDFLEETLQQKGVNTAYLLRTSQANTALAFVSIRADGERDFSFYRTPCADVLLEKEEIRDEWFQAGDIYHFGSVSLIQEPAKQATLAGVEKALHNGLIVSFDPNVRLPLWEDARQAKTEILHHIPQAHVVKLSEEELYFLTDIKDEALAVRSLFEGNVQLVLLTKGKEGCTYYTPHGMGSVPGISVQPIDTTGAGDAFVGGFLGQLAKAEPESPSYFGHLVRDKERLEQMIAFANICGALTTTKRGAIPALPSYKEVQAIIEAGVQ
jgi:fructokinase